MKSGSIILIAVLCPAFVLAAVAQNDPSTPPPPASVAAAPPPPPPMAQPVQEGTPATHISRVAAVVYGPQGEVQALTLRNGVSVSLPPDLGAQLEPVVTNGARVQVSGLQRVIAGQTAVVAQSITANRQTFVATQVAPGRAPGRGPGLAGPGLPPPPVGGPDALPPLPRAARGPLGPPLPPPGAALPPPPADANSPQPPARQGATPAPPAPGAVAPAPQPEGAPAPPATQM